MIPKKDKALELIKQFSQFTDGEIDGEEGFEYSSEQNIINAKKCAIIAVNEIITNIEATMLHLSNSLYFLRKNREYWEGVKTFLD